MNFLRLLNPRDPAHSGVDGPGRQQRAAAAQFPELVAGSLLRYWRPGDAIATSGQRFLIGAAASYSLYDLRFLDVVNQSLRDHRPNVVVDTFNLDDLRGPLPLEAAWRSYFPGTTVIYMTPVIGEWMDGRFIGLSGGGSAMDHVLKVVGSTRLSSQICRETQPPEAELMADYEIER